MGMTQHKRKIQWFLAVLAIAYIVYYFYHKRHDIDLVLNIRPWALFLIMAFHLVYFAIHSFRLQVVVEKFCGARLRYIHWFRLFMLGGFLNKLLPQAGNIYRAVQLKSYYQVSYTHFATAFVFFTWVDTFLNFSIVSIIIIGTGFSLELAGIQAVYVLPVLALLVMVLPFLLDKVLRNIRIEKDFISSLHKKFSVIVGNFVAAFNDPAFSGKIIVLGLIAFIPMCIRIYVTFLMLDVHLSLQTLVLFYALLKLSQLVNLTPGNLGIQELALGYVSEEAGVGMENGIIAALILRMLAYILLMFCGILFGGIGLIGQKEKYAAQYRSTLLSENQKPNRPSQDRK